MFVFALQHKYSTVALLDVVIGRAVFFCDDGTGIWGSFFEAVLSQTIRFKNLAL